MSDLTQRVRVSLPNGASIWVEAEPMSRREVDVAAFEGLPEALSLDSVRQAIEGVPLLSGKPSTKQRPKRRPSSLASSWASTAVN